MTDLTFANLVDIEQIRELLEAHYKITGVCAGILDTDENILVAVGYHDICTRFHLVHPVAKLNCRESDAYIKAHLSECKDGYLDYRCKNGLVDVAFPIIIRDVHLATFFTGQFFYDDDKPDVEFFREQAKTFGFDENGYLEALGRVPVFSRDWIHKIVEYYRHLVRVIAGMGLKNLELRREASERERTESVITSRLSLLRFAATHTLDELLEATLDEAEALTGSVISFYHFLEADQKTLSLQNWSARTKNKFCTADGKWLHYDVSAAGVWVDCIHERRPVIHNDYASLLHRKGMPPGHAPVVRELAVPVFRGDRIMAILGVGNKPQDYTTQDVETVALLADLAWEIAERKQAEEALLLSQYCIDKAGIGVYQGDHTGAIFSVNEQACKSLGYSKEELCALSVFDIDPEITPEKMLELGKILDEKRTTTLYTTHLRKDGTTFPVEITINCLDFRAKRYGISFVKDITERKQAEEERRKSEENFSIIFQATPDLIAITRAGDGKILEVNEAFSRLLGYSRSEAIGKCTEELFIWADPTDRARWMAELEATGQINEFETTLRCRDGSLITCVSTARPLDFGGEKCVLSVVRDITEHKRAGEELQLTQFCVDKASLALYQLTEEGDIWNVNECACQSLGYSMEELRSMTVFDIDPTATREVYNDLVSKMFACGSITFERIHRRKDGTTFPVEITANSLEFRGRKLSVCFVKDITERKQAEEELRKSRQMLMSVLDNFPGVVFWKDRNSVYMGCNKNFSLAAGLSEPSEIVGRRDYDLHWKNDAEWYLADDRQVIESGVPKLNIIETLLHADGRVAWFETSKVPLFDEDGKVFAVLGASNDITERKRVEEALQKSRDELEISVRERTGQLTSLTAELSLAEERERRRIATELHDQVGQTLILSKIKLDSLSRSLSSESFGKQIKEISKYLDQSIQDIRSLTFQLSPPLLYEVGFEAAVEWLGEEFEGKYGLQMEFRDDGKKKPLAEEASVALYQMVRELLLNVAKHAKAKKVRISIGKVSGKIKINVADDGSGFEFLNGMRGKNKKSGFGLFNIRHRIEYMGGEFKIKSKIDQGTSITLILPVKTEINSTNGKIP